MTTPRPLTLLERAILRAVVELGDEAYTGAIWVKAAENRGRSLDRSAMLVSLKGLEAKGYVQGDIRRDRRST